MKLNNNYEKLYGIEGYKKYAEYKLLNNDDLAHDIAGQGLNTFLGIGYNTAFYSLLEQNIGKDVYDDAFKLNYNYLKFIENQNEIIDLKQKYEQNEEILKITLNSIESAIERIKEIDKELKELRENSPDEVKKINELVDERATIKDRIIKNDDFCQNYERINIDMKRMINNYQRSLEQSLQVIKDILKDKNFNKLEILDDENFKDKILSDFLVSCVLPNKKGEAKDAEAEKVMAYGQAEFARAKLESEYLRETILEASSLLKEIDEKGKDFEVDEKRKLTAEILKDKSNLSTDIASYIPVEIENKNVNEYNVYLLDQLEKIEKGQDCDITQKFAKRLSIYNISNSYFGIEDNSFKRTKDACNSSVYNEPFVRLYDKIEKLKEIQENSNEQENE